MSQQSHLKQLAAVLECDHEALDRLFEKARYLPALGMFAAFRALIEHHISAEEPAVQQLVDDGLCPENVAARIARSHELMVELIAEARTAMRDEDDEAFARAFDQLIRLAAAHETTEVLAGLRTHVAA